MKHRRMLTSLLVIFILFGGINHSLAEDMQVLVWNTPTPSPTPSPTPTITPTPTPTPSPTPSPTPTPTGTPTPTPTPMPEPTPTPTPEPRLTIASVQENNPRSIACGCYDTVALKLDGSLRCTESFYERQFSGSSGIVAVFSGSRSVGVTADGRVVSITSSEEYSEWQDIVSVSGGFYSTFGLKRDGTLVAYYDNNFKSDDYGQGEAESWTGIAAIACNDYHVVGLKYDGTVVAAGSNNKGQCDVGDWRDIVDVAVGMEHTVGLRSNGTVVATGTNHDGRCDVSDWRDIVAIACGGFNTVGLKSDGTVVATGWNNYGQCDVGDWRDIVAIACGNVHTVGLKRNGTAVAVGDNVQNPCNVGDWESISTLTVEEFTALQEAQRRTEEPTSDIEVMPEPTPTAAPVQQQPQYTVLKKGDSGDDVIALQIKLIERNYLNDKADGDFGGKTEKAIKQVQADAGYEQTGIADVQTQEYLESHSTDFTPSKDNDILFYAATFDQSDGYLRYYYKNTGRNDIESLELNLYQCNESKSSLGTFYGDRNTKRRSNWTTRNLNLSGSLFNQVLKSGDSDYSLWELSEGTRIQYSDGTAATVQYFDTGRWARITLKSFTTTDGKKHSTNQTLYCRFR